MKYIVIYRTEDKGIMVRVGPFSTLKQAVNIVSKIHESRGPFISEERATLPDTASEPLPEFYRYILHRENVYHKSIEKLCDLMGKKTPFKFTWTKV